MTRDELVADLASAFWTAQADMTVAAIANEGDRVAIEAVLDRLEQLGWKPPADELAVPDCIVIRGAADLDTLIGNVLDVALTRGLADEIRAIVKNRFTADRIVGEGRNVRESLLNALSGSADANEIATRIITALRAALAGEETQPRVIAGETAPSESIAGELAT